MILVGIVELRGILTGAPVRHVAFGQEAFWLVR
jgi:hypothetical protein